MPNAPTSLGFSKPTDAVNLIIHGQGVLLFKTTAPCTFTLYPKDRSDGLQVALSPTEFLVTRLSNTNQYATQNDAKKGGLVTHSGAYYWFSLDSQNQLLQGGVGEPRIETATYVYQFPKDKLWEANKIFLESLVSIQLSESMTPTRLLKDPITSAVPLLIKGTQELTMDDVAGTTYIASAALAPAAQTLYNCVAGAKFILNTPDFPDFTDAIEYSIATSGMWCNTRLKEKATEFSDKPHPLETYLRITLGQNNGESPGIPYVMEIWPVGHYSPIHNHGDANAVIRVLHGTIHVSLYPYLCDEPGGVSPFATCDFKKNDITWLSPMLNQIHMLKNLEGNKETCITIQCYLYDSNNVTHYDYFDYLGDRGAKAQYEPDSDMDFIAFKELMRTEWSRRTRPVAQVGTGCSASCFGCWRGKN
jgi:hypothetical protein